MLEPWPDEPDEPDAEARWGNPERDLPRIPEVSTDESDVDPETFKTFWTSVVFANAAVLGVSLGAMLWFFRDQALLGGVLVFAGVLAGLRTYASYRSFKNRDRDLVSETGAAADGGTDGNDDAGDDDTGDGDGGNAGDDADRAAADPTDTDPAERNG